MLCLLPFYTLQDDTDSLQKEQEKNGVEARHPQESATGGTVTVKVNEKARHVARQDDSMYHHSLQVEICYTKPVRVVLEGQLGGIAKCLARKEYQKLVKLLLSHSEIGKLLTDAVVRKMQLQCEVLVSTKFNSILRRKGKEDLLNFSWDALLQEWEKQAPIFFNFLKSSASTPAVRNAQPIADKTIAPVCMAGAILLKTRSQSMSALQRIVSMLLNAWHVSKQVTWEKCIHIQRQYDELNAFLCRPMCDCSELVCACHTPSQFGLLIRQQPATPVNLWSGRQLLKRASKTCILWYVKYLVVISIPGPCLGYGREGGYVHLQCV